MKYQCFIILIATLFSACSSTIIVNNDKSSFNELKNELEDEKVTIVMNDGQEIIGVQVKVSNKTIDWLDPNTNKWQFAPISNVDKIIITNNSSGAWEGFGFGAATGFVAGLIAESSSRPTTNKSGMMSNYGYSGIGPIVFTIGFSIIGAPIGAIIGHRDNYILYNPQKLNGENRNQEKEIYTIEIKSIIKKTTQYITVLWKQQAIRLPRFKIINLINKENKILIKISKGTYITYFK